MSELIVLHYNCFFCLVVQSLVSRRFLISVSVHIVSFSYHISLFWFHIDIYLFLCFHNQYHWNIPPFTVLHNVYWVSDITFHVVQLVCQSVRQVGMYPHHSSLTSGKYKPTNFNTTMTHLEYSKQVWHFFYNGSHFRLRTLS